MPRIAPPVSLAPEQANELRRTVRASTSSASSVTRCQIVLLASAGETNQGIADALEIPEQTVSKWRRRFVKLGLAGLQDSRRSGRPMRLSAEAVNTVLTQVTKPPASRTQWSIRSMARHAGVSKSHVQTLWSRNDIKPHIRRTFKLSRDPNFEPKFWDIVGLYLNPPQKALILCCDEKSQVQALDRTQPGLPLKRGRAETMTHDYKRNGTTTLFAALNVLDGQVIGQCQQRHTHVEWLKFLKKIDRETPKAKTLHLIADNYATHKHPVVQEWLAKHPRFNMHFTPTSASWLNMVERFFRDITTERLRRGVFTSVPELVAAIDEYVAHHNNQPKPFIWTKSARDILQKVIRANSRLSTKQNAALH